MSSVNRAKSTGHTLIEMVMSVGILAIVMVATGSAIILAGRAIPARENVTTHTTRALRAQDQIAAELAYATSVTELVPTSISFTIPDRDGDGLQETVRYSWSGTGGDALIREYNGIASDVVGDVQDFQLTYVRRSELLATSYSEGSEVTLFSYDSSTNLDTHPMTSANWIGQYFKPAIPSDASSWRITRVLIRARQSGEPVGETRIQIRNADSNELPGNIVYDQVSMAESTLPTSFQWKELHFAQAGGLPPGKGVCVTTQWVRDVYSCEIQFRGGIGGIGGMFRTSTSGSAWGTASSGHCIPMQVYGRISKQNPDAYRYLLSEVRLSLRTGSDPAAGASTSVRLINAPEVSAP